MSPSEVHTARLLSFLQSFPTPQGEQCSLNPDVGEGVSHSSPGNAQALQSPSTTLFSLLAQPQPAKSPEFKGTRCLH
jgi:hypothetical protein